MQGSANPANGSKKNRPENKFPAGYFHCRVIILYMGDGLISTTVVSATI